MTLKEIEEQLKAAYEAPIDAEGNNTFFSLLPRLHYSELPIELQEKVDETFTIEKITDFLKGCVKDDILDNLETDPAKLEADIIAAIHNSIYNITRDEVDEGKAEVCLLSRDFLNAWKEQTTKTAAPDPANNILKSNLENIKAQKVNSFDYPLDKANSNTFNNRFWNDVFKEEANGQFKLNIDVSKRGSKKPIDIYYCLDFSDIKGASITRRLNAYDKLVYLAIAAIFNAGQDKMSINQIYEQMGGKNTPPTSEKKKIYESIAKMSAARLYIDNIQEATAYNYTHFKYEGQLLESRIISAYINGQFSNCVIYILAEPPLISFARERKQITTFDIKLLQAPMNKTNTNLEIQFYLFEQLSHMKREAKEKKAFPFSKKLLYETIYTNADIKERKQKARALETVNKLLDHFKKEKFISSYKEAPQKDGVIICLEN